MAKKETVVTGPLNSIEDADAAIAALQAQIKAARMRKRELKGPVWRKPTEKPGKSVGNVAKHIQPETQELLNQFVDYFTKLEADVPTIDDVVQTGMGRIVALDSAKRKKANGTATRSTASETQGENK